MGMACLILRKYRKTLAGKSRVRSIRTWVVSSCLTLLAHRIGSDDDVKNEIRIIFRLGIPALVI
jgi:hypothetical protein